MAIHLSDAWRQAMKAHLARPFQRVHGHRGDACPGRPTRCHPGGTGAGCPQVRQASTQTGAGLAGNSKRFSRLPRGTDLTQIWPDPPPPRPGETAEEVVGQAFQPAESASGGYWVAETGRPWQTGMSAPRPKCQYFSRLPAGKVLFWNNPPPRSAEAGSAGTVNDAKQTWKGAVSCGFKSSPRGYVARENGLRMEINIKALPSAIG